MSEEISRAARLRCEHEQRIARSNAKMERANERMAKNRRRGIQKSLQQAARHFLPAEQELDWVPRLDLTSWPYAGTGRIEADIPLALRTSILEQDKLCLWCRMNPATTIDHVRPLSRGGTNHPLNLIGSCNECNSVKSDFMPSELHWTLRLPQRAFHIHL